MSEPRATHIEIRYEDGSREFADGDAAAQIWSWLNSCQVMASIHGSCYNGPKLTMEEATRHD